MMTRLKVWINTFRLHTLPLALSTICLGTLLAVQADAFDITIFILAIFTTLFLQVLSNLANDYGDARSGVDNSERKGPIRSLQKGMITIEELRKAIIWFITLSIISGVLLLAAAFKNSDNYQAIIFFLIGLMAIGAALKYTVGKNPYGYSGLGDVAVFIFFGLVGVLGSYYLYTHTINHHEILPAITIGLFSTAVLNLNNMRDRENDARHDKKTLAVRMSKTSVKVYHTGLITMGWIIAVNYNLLFDPQPINFSYIILLPLFILHIKRVWEVEDLTRLNPELRNLALSTFAFSLLYGISLFF